MTKFILTLSTYLTFMAGSGYVYINFDEFYSLSNAPIGEVVNAEGDVYSKQIEELLDTKVRKSQKISNKSIVSTGANSKTTIVLKNQQEINISENSIVEINLNDNSSFEILIMAGIVEVSKQNSTNIKNDKITVKKALNYVPRAPISKNISNDLPLPKENVKKTYNETPLLDQYIRDTYTTPKKIFELTKEPAPFKSSTPPLPLVKKNKPKNETPYKPKTKYKQLSSKTSSTSPPLFPKGYTELKKSITISQRLPDKRFWVKSLNTKVPFLFGSTSSSVKFFVFKDKDKKDKLYLKKVHKNYYRLDYSFKTLSKSSQIKMLDKSTLLLSFDVWAQDSSNSKKLKKVFTSNAIISILNLIKGKAFKAKIEYQDTNHSNAHIDVKQEASGTQELFVSSLDQFSKIWGQFKSIHSIIPVSSLNTKNGKMGYILEGNKIAYASKDKFLIQKLSKIQKTSTLSFYGRLASFLGHMGSYKEMTSLLKKKNLNRQSGKIYFYIEGDLIDVKVKLLFEDPSVYNLIKGKYKHAFSEFVEIY